MKSGDAKRSPRNGDIMSDGRIYCRMYDFTRDDNGSLVKKRFDPVWTLDNHKRKYIPDMDSVLIRRIRKGSIPMEFIKEELVISFTRNKYSTNDLKKFWFNTKLYDEVFEYTTQKRGINPVEKKSKKKKKYVKQKIMKLLN